MILMDTAFTESGERNDEMEIEMRIEELLYCQYQGYKNRIAFDNTIMSYQVRNTGEQSLHYTIKK